MQWQRISAVDSHAGSQQEGAQHGSLSTSPPFMHVITPSCHKQCLTNDANNNVEAQHGCCCKLLTCAVACGCIPPALRYNARKWTGLLFTKQTSLWALPFHTSCGGWMSQT